MCSSDKYLPAAGCTRREFLVYGSAAVGAGAGFGLHAAGARADHSIDADEGTAPRVIRIRSENLVRVRRVDVRVLRQMLDTGLTRLMRTESPDAAWRKLLSPDDVVALKFNRSAASELQTTEPMAEALVDSLKSAGISPEHVVAVEVSDAVHRRLGVRRPKAGWADEEVSFGSGSDSLAAFLDDVTAIINVPFMKTHNIAGITCSLKNLSHALVKHPARYHDNHCSPYIADIINLPQILRKLRLHVVNAIRAVYDGGPEAHPDGVATPACLLLGVDPVAIDAIALEELNQLRHEQGLGQVESVEGLPPFLRRAEEVGLGRAVLHEIKYERILL